MRSCRRHNSTQGCWSSSPEVINCAKVFRPLCSEAEAGRARIAVQRFRGAVAGVGQQAGVRFGITVVGHGFRTGPVRAEGVGSWGNAPRLLRGVAAVAEIVVRNAVGRRPVIRLHVRATAADVAADPFGLAAPQSSRRGPRDRRPLLASGPVCRLGTARGFGLWLRFTGACNTRGALFLFTIDYLSNINYITPQHICQINIMSNKVGRPRIPKSKAKAILYGARVAVEEAPAINRAIAESGQTPTEVIRKALDDVARLNWTTSRKWKPSDLHRKRVEFHLKRSPDARNTLSGVGLFFAVAHRSNPAKLAL